MIPKDCKRPAEMDFPIARCRGTRRERSAVEVWVRGTKRVIEMCEKHGAPPPGFVKKQRFLVVTFGAPLVAGGAAGSSRNESMDPVGTKSGLSRDQVTAQVAAFCCELQPAKAITVSLGPRQRETCQANYLAPLVAMGILERTIPDKPRSGIQRYRTKGAGLAILRTHQISRSSASRKSPMPRGMWG